MNKTEKQGYLYNLGHNIFWSIFPVISIVAYQKIHSLYVASFSSAIAFIFFLIIVWKKKQFKYFLNKEALKYTLFASLTIGIAYYGLIFYGISKTSAGNAGIIMLMEIFFTFVILNLFKAEKSTKNQIIGSTLMVIGAIFVIFPGKIQLNLGDLIILIATMFPPLGNHWMRKAREFTSSSFIMLIRSSISAITFFIIAISVANIPSFTDINSILWVLLINGIFVIGLGKIFWIEGIHRIPITICISMSTISPLLTLFFAYFILKDIPTLWQLSAIIPMTIGVFILMKKTNNIAK